MVVLGSEMKGFWRLGQGVFGFGMEGIGGAEMLCFLGLVGAVDV